QIPGPRPPQPAPRPANPALTAAHRLPPGYPAPPGGAFPPGYPMFAPPPPRRRRNGTLVAVVLILVLAAAAAIPVTALFASGQTGSVAEPEVSLYPSPTEGDPPEVREKWLSQQVELQLDSHAEALFEDDLDAWLDVFDPSLHDVMEDRFDTLRNMAVSQYDYQVLEGPIDAEEGVVGYRLGVVYCFGGEVGEECASSAVVLDTEWSDEDSELRMTEVSDSHEVGPRPWETDYLEAEVGERAIVAAPRKYADKLAEAVEVADEAAANADEYAVYVPVERYVVYLAGEEEFDRWFGFGADSMTNVVGFAVPLPTLDDEGEQVPGGSEVVMHAERTRDSFEFESTMRHELGHVATLNQAPDERYSEDRWWLAEGIAELIDHGPENSLDAYPRNRDVEQYLSGSDWDRDFAAASNSDDALTGSAKYGIAFYGAYYVFNEYGKDEFMEFFGKIAREGADSEEAAQEVYGKSYSDLLDEMADFVEDEAG
ncbi:MAG: hypothetical protein ACRDXX_18335, partial [Stackebrandtia sp.]